jgi:hypothetical protein
MATPPVFLDTEILYASSMNKIGMWKVASGSLSTATTNFQGCFTPDYRNYRIVINSMGASGAADFYIRLLQGASEVTGATGNNYWAYRGIDSAGAAGDSSAAANVAWYLGLTFSGATTVSGQSIIDITTPQIAAKTMGTVQSANLITGAYMSRNGMCAFDTTAVFDGFAVKSLSAATLSGNVTIYGYRD